MDYIYKIKLEAGGTTICTRKVRTEEEGEFQAKELLKNSKDATEVEYFLKKGSICRRSSSKEEIICNYILKTYSQLYEKPLKKYPDASITAVYKATYKIVDDIESYLNIPFNGDRTSLKEGVIFIQQHIEDLRYRLEYEKEKYEMDLYNADIVDIVDTY
mgnify:CR=1 FL=1